MIAARLVNLTLATRITGQTRRTVALERTGNLLAAGGR